MKTKQQRQGLVNNARTGANVMHTHIRLSRIAHPRATQGAMVLLLIAFVVFSAAASILG